jgi:hypothetical protein
MEKCCKLCKYYEDRTRFCRLNPPTPVIIQKHEHDYINSVFPSIKYSDSDFCSYFEIDDTGLETE